LDTTEPSKSKALEYAVKTHGKAKAPPLRDESHPAYATLELWLHTAASKEGTAMLASVPRVRKPTSPTPSIMLVSGSEVPKPMPNEPAPLPMLKTTPLKPVDEFDPVQFNQSTDPKKK
jgi:hypothetical protein